MHGSIGCRASSAIYLGLYFHCAALAACTHIPFQNFAIALANGFSSESLLKYERLKQQKKKTCPSAWLVLSFFFFFERQKFLLMKG